MYEMTQEREDDSEIPIMQYPYTLLALACSTFGSELM